MWDFYINQRGIHLQEVSIWAAIKIQIHSETFGGRRLGMADPNDKMVCNHMLSMTQFLIPFGAPF